MMNGNGTSGCSASYGISGSPACPPLYACVCASLTLPLPGSGCGCAIGSSLGSPGISFMAYTTFSSGSRLDSPRLDSGDAR